MANSPPGAAPYHEFTVGGEQSGERLDKALAALAAAAGLALSRSRIAQQIAEGAVTVDGSPARSASEKVRAGQSLHLAVPEPVDAEPEPEAIPLSITFEDADLLVIDKPAGMVVHPAPGSPSGTLVNALLHHCGPDLPGIGGERRPGIVHRIDKDTSGLLVVAKSEAAMAGLAALFARHDIDRRYLALAWGAPDRASPRLASVPGVSFTQEGEIAIRTRIARDPADRKRMAVVEEGGREAVSYFRLLERFGVRGFASLIEARLETGRTHQIRVHAAHIGHPLIGDPVYGRARALPRDADPGLPEAIAELTGQALHAAELGFTHPVTGENLHFQSDPPPGFQSLLKLLRRNPGQSR